MTIVVTPFSGRPLTRQCREEDGSPAFHIIPRELTPLRARIADTIALTGALAAACAVPFFIPPGVDPFGCWHWVLAYAGLWFGYPYLKGEIRNVFRKEARIVMTETEFRVRAYRGWKVFNRQLPHSFALVAHDRTQEEHRRLDLHERREQLRGRIISRERYYGESYHLSFQYLDQRNDVLTIYGHKEAFAVLARLRACDGVLNAQARTGEGIALDPEDQWGDQPGEIPENDPWRK